VDKTSESFGSFYSPIKVKCPGEKGKILVETGAAIYFSPKKIF